MTDENIKFELEEKAAAVKRLLHNKDFQNVVLNDFIEQGILDYTLNDNVSSEAVQRHLWARKLLHEYLYGIIEEAEKQKI